MSIQCVDRSAMHEVEACEGKRLFDRGLGCLSGSQQDVGEQGNEDLDAYGIRQMPARSVTGGYPLPDVSGASACSLDWRDAPLFAGLETADASANRRQFDGRSGAAPNAAETDQTDARFEMVGTLFVSRSSGEGFR